jgi:hypothetical protein
MKAFSPTGSPIVGTADLIPGNALIQEFHKLPDGTLEIDWASETDVCWDGQFTKTSHDPGEIQQQLVEALEATLKLLRVFTRETDEVAKSVWDMAEAAIQLTKTEGETLYVDEEGLEWRESQLVLKEDDDAPAT